MKDSPFGTITGDWDYRELPANMLVAPDCWIERKSSFASFRSTQATGLSIGNRTRIYMWSTFNVEPAGSVRIGQDCVLVGPTFMCADQIRIGDRVLISYQVTLADADFHPLDASERRQDAVANAPFASPMQRPEFRTAPIVIEDDVAIGIGAIILKGVHIGRGARIAPGSVITRDVPAGAWAVGNPPELRSPGA